MVAYLGLSVFEHFLVETGKSHPTLPWDKFTDIPSIVLNGGKVQQRDNSEDPESLTLTSQTSSSSSSNMPTDSKFTFDFSNNRTKMVYAGAKFCVAACYAACYILLFKVTFTLPYEKTQEKSVFFLSILVLLSIYRDKHEKKIATMYDAQSLHVGRALMTPLIYISFTVLSLIDQSLASFLTATAYQLGFIQFYFDYLR